MAIKKLKFYVINVKLQSHKEGEERIQGIKRKSWGVFRKR